MSLIFDIGFNNGDDTAFYLSKGHEVVAVEANPLLVNQGKFRFASEVDSGRLKLVNCGVWHTSGTKLPFYINESDDGWSSFVPDWGQKGGKFSTIEVECVTLSDLFSKYGIPWYLKVDIEGADEAVIKVLTTENSPKYFSCELGHGSSTLDRLSLCGYRDFKLINQKSFTDSIPIMSDDLLARALRKISYRVPGAMSLIRNLPNSIRPKRILWDSFHLRHGWDFSGYSSGPFAEETGGRWRRYEDIKPRIDRLFARYAKLGNIEDFWYDLHARKSDHAV